MAEDFSTDLQLDGGRSPRMKQRPRRITPAQDEAFFDALANSCNVKHSAREAGVSVQHCYTRRREDAAYAKRWEQALAEGYEKLEMALLERALVGSEKVTTYRDAEDATVRSSVVREYNNALAMSLLKMHRDAVRSRGAVRLPDADEVRAARASIEAKLAVLSERAERRKAED